MAAQGDLTAGAERAGSGEGRRRSGLSSELIAILAVGAMTAGTMLTMMMGAFEENFASVRGEFTSIRGEFTSVRGEIAALREEVASNQGEIAALRDGVADLQMDVRALQAGQMEIRERMARVESKVDMLAGDWPPEPARSTGG